MSQLDLVVCNTHQGSPVCVEVTNSELLHKLGESHGQEVEVEEEFELAIENL